MGLVTECGNCESSWLVDQLVYVELVKENLCPVCINDLVDRLTSKISETTLHNVLNAWEEDA